MLTEKFDAYGEVLPDAAAGREGSASAVLSRIGQSLFWLLVVMIVSARIIYYPASPTFVVGSAGEPTHTVAR
jgi:hypothetical protein